MRDAGVRLLQPSSEVAVVGLVEVLSHLPAIRRAMARLVQSLVEERPDLLVPIDFPDFNRRGQEVIGVVRDFHNASFRDPIGPVILLIHPRGAEGRFLRLLLKIDPEDIEETLAFMEEQWKRFIPGYPFEFAFLDDLLMDDYLETQRQVRVFGVASALAVMS